MKLSIARRRAPLLALAGLFFATGCAASPDMHAGAAMAPPPAYAPAAMEAMASPGADAPAAAPAMPGAPAPRPAAAGGAAQYPAQPSMPLAATPGQKAPAVPAPAGAKSAAVTKAAALVMYRGELAMQVAADDTAAALDRAVDAAEQFGGHLAGRNDGSVTVKVPSENFREAMRAIEKLGSVTRRSVHAEDVTAEYRDLEVRIENLTATRKRLEEFLARAANIQEMLTVEQELERVAQELDVLRGRLRFLREHTSFSTLTVAISPRPAAVAVVNVPPPPPPAPRAIDLPVSWLGGVGLESLLTLAPQDD